MLRESKLSASNVDMVHSTFIHYELRGNHAGLAVRWSTDISKANQFLRRKTVAEKNSEKLLINLKYEPYI